MSSLVHVDSKEKDILVLGEGPTQELDDTMITPEAKYPINFTESGKKFRLSLSYNKARVVLFVNAIKMHQFKAKASEIKPYPLCLGNISKDFTLVNMEKNMAKRKCKSFFC